MSDQTPKALRQSLLEQINADKKAVEALSDEELEAVAGGFILANTSEANIAVTMPKPKITVSNVSISELVTPNLKQHNTGGVRSRQPLEGLGPGIDPNIL